MTSVSFEENIIVKLDKFTKVSNCSLSVILEDYQDFLNATLAADLNFARAGKIVESSAKVYSVQVDNLCDLTHDLQLLISKKHGTNHAANDGNDGAGDADEAIHDRSAAKVGRQRRRRVKEVGTEDEFFVIDNTELAGKCTEDADKVSSNIAYIKPSEPYFNPFVKCGSEREKVDVRLKKTEEQKDSCLRDYQLTLDLMLVPELFSNLQLPEEAEVDDANSLRLDVSDSEDFMDVGPLTPRSEGVESDISEISVQVANIRGVGNGCLATVMPDMDVGEKDVAGSSNSEDMRTTLWVDSCPMVKPLDPGNTTKLPPCSACPIRKRHKENGRNCIKRLSVIEKYFHPHVQKQVKEPAWGVLPLQELQAEFRTSSRLLARLVRARGNSSVTGDDPGDDEFEGFEDKNDREENEIDDDGVIGECDLPLPAMPCVDSIALEDDVLSQGSDGLNDINFQEMVEIHRATESSAASRRRVAEWHSSLKSTLALAEERGPLHIDTTADKIMSMFNGVPDETRTFDQITAGADRSTASRLFFVCLQLTNEGNVDLIQGDDKANATFKRLRNHRLKMVDDYNPEAEGAGSSTSKRTRDDEHHDPKTVQKRAKKGNAKHADDHTAKRPRR